MLFNFSFRMTFNADNRFRQRLDTGCTADSKDSGIDVSSRYRDTKASQILVPVTIMESGIARTWDVDAILWIIAFALTVWFFRLPLSIWFARNVDWTLMKVSTIFFSIFALSGLLMYYKYRSLSRWRLRSPILFIFAWISFGCGVYSFSLSTWALFGWWSLYISTVTFMFLLSAATLIS